jgi:prephenate dehydratase
MAKPQRVPYFKINVEDRPGALLAILQDLKSRNINLSGLRGENTTPGQAEVYLSAKSADKLRNAWKSSGMNFEEGTGFFVKGTDKTGALVKTLDAIAKAGVSMVTSEAMAVSGNYGLFIRVAPGDVEKTAQALGAK